MRPLLLLLVLGVLLTACSAPPPPAGISPDHTATSSAPQASALPSDIAPAAAPCLGGGPFPPILSGLQYGVNAFLLGTDAGRVLDLATNAEFGWVRQQIHWRDVEGLRNQFVWEPVDQAVEQAQAHHVSLMLSVVRSPDWAAPTDGLPADTVAFAGFMSALATRYRGRVAAYQVWNEPNLAVENGGAPATPAAYLATLKAAYPALKAADPCALVISAGLAATSSGDRALAANDLDFLDQLYQLDGGAFLRSADVVDMHPGGGPYDPAASWPDDQPAESAHYFRHIERVRAIMQRYHDPRQAWLSELGWAVSIAPGAPAPVSPQQQADFLVAALRRVRQEYGWISGAFVWNLNFNVLGGSDDEKSTFGILNHDWSPRPAYMALQNYLHSQAREAANVQPMIDTGAPYSAAWSVAVTGKSHTDPLRGPDGALYVGTDPGYLYAFGPAGGLRWRFNAPGGVRSAPAIGPDGTIYVADDSGAISALSPDGALIWQQDLGLVARGSPLLRDGAIYLSTDTGLLRLSLRGDLIWQHDLGAAAAPPILVSAPGGPLLVAGTAAGVVAALDGDGKEIWRASVGAPVAAAATTDRAGGLLVGDAAGTLHCLDLRTGALRWKHAIVHEVAALIVANGGALIVAPPLVAADGSIYLGGRDGSLTALGPDGAVRWRYETGSDIAATPAQVADGTILVGLLDWRVLGMSPEGRLGWSIRLNGSVRSTPLRDADGTLYITTVGGRLYAMKANRA